MREGVMTNALDLSDGLRRSGRLGASGEAEGQGGQHQELLHGGLQVQQKPRTWRGRWGLVPWPCWDGKTPAERGQGQTCSRGSQRA